MTFPEGDERVWVQYTSWCNRCGMKILNVVDHPGDGQEAPVWIHESTFKRMCQTAQPYATPGNNEIEFIGRYEDVVW